MKEKQKILIVEDEAVNRIILKKLLSDAYEIVEAANGAEAWGMLEQKGTDIDAVLLDILMPVMNGYELLQKIKRANMTELPVIVMTGETDAATEKKALDAGAWDFVSKPYNAQVLLSRLRNAIARRQVSVYMKMQKMAAHDPLTGLHNRSRMFAQTRKILDAHPDVTFMFIRADIDHFALYNSAFGEEEGDRLLCYLARVFEELAKPYPLNAYGRINADVFCTCLPYGGDETVLQKAVELTQKKLAEYRKDYLLEVSVGVYIIEDSTLSVEECFIRATMAAQQCKNQYGKHIGYFDAAAQKHALEEITITNEMQTALDEEQFLVYLQPKFDLKTDTACGAEALVRWRHPARGLISPGLFIPVFERNGFIAQLDYYVWEHTCRMLRAWLDAGKQPSPISVNISRVSLYNPNLSDVIVGLVGRYQLPNQLLQLEVTESAYMTNPELLSKTIHQLRAAGFTVLMDDFGSGYSSRNTLKEIEIDILKIDMKFLPVGDEQEKAEIILASMIRMANWMGMPVVVEGVETRKQRDFLEGVGCDYIQGYYYERPIAQAEYEKKYLIDPQTQAVQAQPSRALPQHNVTILVVDDCEVDREILKQYFADYYYVQLCASAEEGLAYLRRNQGRVRLILVDNVMDGMSGLDFLIYCQSNPSLSVIPQIMITANDRVEDQVRAFRSGAYDYITKPLVKEIVLARVDHVMSISRQFGSFEDTQRRFRNLAEQDRATGLLNKTAFQELGGRALAAEPKDLKAMLILDLDNFKGVNDRLGHLTGDAVLHSAADVLAKSFRKTDLVARFGGDEFVVLMSGLPSHNMVRKKAMEVIKMIAATSARELQIGVGASVGIAYFEEGDTMRTLLARADQALYEAKTTGKGKAVIYGEQVPPIRDDDKPLVLVCGEDPQLYPALALGYGESAAFAQITSMAELNNAFERYRPRIRAICMDMQKKIMRDADLFYQQVLDYGGGTNIPLIAVCREGDMHHLRQAVTLRIEDVLMLPPQIDAIQRILSRVITAGCVQRQA